VTPLSENLEECGDESIQNLTDIFCQPHTYKFKENGETLTVTYPVVVSSKETLAELLSA
jgi:CheY-specific phosphatase CheX